jgi:hypothetical protein
MADRLLDGVFRVVLDERTGELAFFSQDVDVAEVIWDRVLGREYLPLMATSARLGSGVRFVPVDRTSDPHALAIEVLPSSGSRDLDAR